MDKRIHAIVASDSRAKDFLTKSSPNAEKYTTHNIICRGARIDRVSSAIASKLRRIPESDFVIIRICAGINELTYRYHHEDGVELVPHTQQNLLQHLLELKEHIRKQRPLSLVGIATIPIINFKRAQEYYVERGWLKKPLFDKIATEQHQQALSDTLAIINSRITKENTIKQYLPDLGTVLPTQCFLHQDIEKYSIRKRGNKRRIRKHIQNSALPDGIHPCDRISDKWHTCIHNNFLREVERVKNPIPLNG
jgi:hypothetical protein